MVNGNLTKRKQYHASLVNPNYNKIKFPSSLWFIFKSFLSQPDHGNNRDPHAKNLGI